MIGPESSSGTTKCTLQPEIRAPDSITRRWGATDYPELLANWKQNFLGWNAADFGWGADRTQNILWRIENGELDNVNPKVVVLLAGTNNIGSGATAADVVSGVEREPGHKDPEKLKAFVTAVRKAEK